MVAPTPHPLVPVTVPVPVADDAPDALLPALLDPVAVPEVELDAVPVLVEAPVPVLFEPPPAELLLAVLVYTVPCELAPPELPELLELLVALPLLLFPLLLPPLSDPPPNPGGDEEEQALETPSEAPSAPKAASERRRRFFISIPPAPPTAGAALWLWVDPDSMPSVSRAAQPCECHPYLGQQDGASAIRVSCSRTARNDRDDALRPPRHRLEGVTRRSETRCRRLLDRGAVSRERGVSPSHRRTTEPGERKEPRTRGTRRRRMRRFRLRA
jgi:hypothetical protein